MKRHSFTMIEILIVVVIIGILATLGLPAYQNIIEDSRSRVCQQNLEALGTALDIYAREHDTIPADLSGLFPGYIERAFAQLEKEGISWRVKLAYFLVSREKRGLAYAGLLHDLAGDNGAVLHCPSDTDGGRSYGMNAILINMPTADYFNNTALPAATTLIGDSDSETFASTDELVGRHRVARIFGSDHYAQGISRGRAIGRIRRGVAGGGGRGVGAGGGSPRAGSSADTGKGKVRAG